MRDSQQELRYLSVKSRNFNELFFTCFGRPWHFCVEFVGAIGV
jgi:hypothetical protein